MRVTEEMVEALVKSIERQVKKRRGIVLEANSRKVCIDGEFVPKAALTAALAHSGEAEPVKGPPFRFARYINGKLMAEGVTIERQTSLEAAAREAARLAPRGPKNEAPVLVLAHPATKPSGTVKAVAEDVLKPVHRLLSMFVMDGSEPVSLLVPDGLDANEFTSNWIAALDAINSPALSTLSAEQPGERKEDKKVKDDEIINLARELWWPHHASRTRETALSELDSGDAGKVAVEFRDIVNIIRAALAARGGEDA